VKGIFYHPEEEKRFQEERGVAQSTHGQSRLQTLPPSIKASDGTFVNITSLELRTNGMHGANAAETLAALDKKRHKSRAGHEQRKDIEARIKEEQTKAQIQAEQRRMNTINLTGRVAQGPSQSYHILTNSAFPPPPIAPLDKHTATTSSMTSLPLIGTGTVVAGNHLYTLLFHLS
jgi:hypothetical protein